MEIKDRAVLRKDSNVLKINDNFFKFEDIFSVVISMDESVTQYEILIRLHVFPNNNAYDNHWMALPNYIWSTYLFIEMKSLIVLR